MPPPKRGTEKEWFCIMHMCVGDSMSLFVAGENSKSTSTRERDTERESVCVKVRGSIYVTIVR